MIDEVRVYDRALSSAAVRCHWQRREHARPTPSVTMGPQRWRRARPYIAVTVAPDRANARLGDILTFTLTYTNRGDAAARDCVFGVPLPDGGVFTGKETFSAPDCTRIRDVPGLQWNVGSIPPGATGWIRFEVRTE